MNEIKKRYVKFRTNIAEPLTFKFDDPKIFDSKFKENEKVYSYTVEHRGEDAFLIATPTLHSLIQKIREQKGSIVELSVEILKYEEGTKKLWKILDAHGNDLTGRISNTHSEPKPASNHQNTPPEIIDEIFSRMDRMAVWAKKMEQRVSELESLIIGRVGRD